MKEIDIYWVDEFLDGILNQFYVLITQQLLFLFQIDEYNLSDLTLLLHRIINNFI